ncbi:MAG: hypothetical protein WDN01_22365 [Rhizomicrobium sp.]
MKILIASIFALGLLGATAATPATAAVGVGVHIGGVGAGVHLGIGDRNRHRYHSRRHCVSWGYRHHQRYCRRWSR